jgi:hypothetical protein
MVFKFAKEFVRRFLEELRKKAEREIDWVDFVMIKVKRKLGFIDK